jgi:hypothetical protein
MRGWKLAALVATVVAPLLPPLVGYLHNEAVIDNALGQLKMSVVHRGRPLGRASRVVSLPEGCSAIAAVSFLASRPRDALNLSLNGPASDYGLAWVEHDRPIAESPIGTPAARIEGPVQKLFDEWLFYADGEQSMVLYQRLPVPNRLDPRCW